MAREKTPREKDGKRLGGEGWKVLPTFLLCLVVLLPLWLVVLLPLTIIFVLIGKLVGLVYRPGKDTANALVAREFSEAELANLLKEQGKPEPLAKRSYDLVLLGATGFTGKLAARYIAKTYGNTIKWAIAGRRQSALEAVRAELAEIDSSMSNLPLLVADTTDIASLGKAVASTRVVITTVGPFVKYGTPVVQLCAELGTSYCDITGESDWVRSVIDRYDQRARDTGARIVHFCGHDCVPWDLSVLAAAKYLNKNHNGESLASVKIFDEIRGEASGGTLDTIFTSLQNRTKLKTALGFDPMLKTKDGSRSDSKTIAANKSMLGYAPEFKAWVGPFVMAMVMANCIRRSNAVLGYGSRLTYSEAIVFPGFMAGFVYMVQMALFATSLVNPPLRYLLRSYVLPKPGEGPSEQSMARGFLQLTLLATGDKGSKARAQMYFSVDPGYRDTARMLVESGLVLALEGDAVSCPGGVWTPAVCQGDLLLNRLVRTGTTFSIGPAE